MAFIAKKALSLLATLLIISLLAFLAFQLIPGDPVTKILGTNTTPELEAELRRELGLDRPLPERYIKWLFGFVGGDMGRSYSYNMGVKEVIAGKLPVTILLSLMSFVLMVVISIPMGLFLARFEGAAMGKFCLALNQIVMSTPQFFVGIMFSYVFGQVFRLFQIGSFTGLSLAGSPGRYLTYLFFPALAIALPRCAMNIKLLRGSILAEMRQDYIRTAYSWGNSRASALVRHALRNAMIPVISFMAVALADILAGSIIIEQIFNIPGIGRLLLISISGRDYPVVQALVVMIAAIVMSVNALADIAYQFIDPRIRIT